MVRRKKKPSRLEVRLSHEGTRQSKAWLAAAFDCVVPTVQRRVERQNTCCERATAATPQSAEYIVRR
jgi:hypothetical protein